MALFRANWLRCVGLWCVVSVTIVAGLGRQVFADTGDLRFEHSKRLKESARMTRSDREDRKCGGNATVAGETVVN